MRRRAAGKIPEIYRVKALADNPTWLGLLHDSIFKNGWPRSCSLDEKTKKLVGLAKSIAHLWEPGVLTNIEGALESGASSEEIAEAVLVTSMVLGLADVEVAIRASSIDANESSSIQAVAVTDSKVQEIYEDAKKTFGEIPKLYRTKPLMENADWLTKIHESAKIRYTPGTLDQKTKALICLSASAMKHWEGGVREHLDFALRSGATMREVVDVLSSTYKTAASIGVQIGFGVPCLPEISGFRLVKDYYAKRKTNRPRRPRGN